MDKKQHIVDEEEHGMRRGAPWCHAGGGDGGEVLAVT